MATNKTNKDAIVFSDSSVINIAGRSLPVKDLSFSDIAMLHRVGRGQTVRGVGSDVHYVYKHSIATKVGEIEEETWYSLIEHLIEREGEQKLFEMLLEWCKQEVSWLKTKKAVRRYALELHAARIFNDEEWCGYAAFEAMRAA